MQLLVFQFLLALLAELSRPSDASFLVSAKGKTVVKLAGREQSVAQGTRLLGLVGSIPTALTASLSKDLEPGGACDEREAPSGNEVNG